MNSLNYHYRYRLRVRSHPFISIDFPIGILNCVHGDDLSTERETGPVQKSRENGKENGKWPPAWNGEKNGSRNGKNLRKMAKIPFGHFSISVPFSIFFCNSGVKIAYLDLSWNKLNLSYNSDYSGISEWSQLQFPSPCLPIDHFSRN